MKFLGKTATALVAAAIISAGSLGVSANVADAKDGHKRAVGAFAAGAFLGALAAGAHSREREVVVIERRRAPECWYEEQRTRVGHNKWLIEKVKVCED